MFNHEARRSLSEFVDLFETVVRDVRFHSTGKIPTRLKAKLVPLGAAKYLPSLLANLDDIAGVICTPDLVDSIPEQLGVAVSNEPQAAQYLVHERLCDKAGYFWTSFESQIDSSAAVHPTAYVSDKDVFIGSGTVIGPQAVVMPRTVIGSDCYVGPHTTLGTEAFETVKLDGRDRLQKQAGGVRLADGVAFLSNATVARSVFPVFSEIGAGSTFDNLVYVGHDALIGEGCKMALGAMIAGRVELGDQVYIGPNATVSNGLAVGSKAWVTMGAVVTRSVDAGERMTGNFAVRHEDFLRRLKAGR